MEKEEIIQKLQQMLQNTKRKTITVSEIYSKLQLPYHPTSDKILAQVLIELINQGKIQPIKTSGRNAQGIFKKYKIVLVQNEEERQIQNEVLGLYSKIDISYYLKFPNEYQKDKTIIEPINQFLQKPNKCMLTVNERSYELFKNEKCLKQNEEILKKLGLSYEDLYAYETYEPFFYYINSNFKNSENKKRVFIIENKDTFWTMKKLVENLQKPSDIYMIIYGEGKKILKSFAFIQNLQIEANDLLLYFGDIDYEGINIYISLKEKYDGYNIQTYQKGYETILDLEQNPQTIRTKQNENQNNMQKFLNEFKEEYKQKLKQILNKKQYIPQEVFNYDVAKDILK